MRVIEENRDYIKYESELGSISIQFKLRGYPDSSLYYSIDERGNARRIIEKPHYEHIKNAST